MTERLVVSPASALVPRCADYFAVLDSNRRGDAYPIIEAFSLASLIAADESALCLEEVGFISPLMKRKRNQVWGAGSLLTKLNDLGLWIGIRAHHASRGE